MKNFTLFIALLIAASCSYGQNLIVNGDFESPGMAADPVPTPWNGFKNRIQNDTTVMSFVGQITNGDGSLFQEFAVTPGETYEVIFDYKWVNSGAANANLVVRIKDAANLPTNLDLIGGTTADGYKLDTAIEQWFDSANFRFVVPVGITSVRMLFFKANGNKTLNLDNFSVSVFTPCTAPVADYAVTAANGLERTFTNQSSGTDLSYLWTFGDGDSSMDASPTHLYDTTGRYVVCLEATDTCGVTVSVCDTVDVFTCGNLLAAYAIADTNELELTFSNQSSGTELSYLWTFGDGDSSMDASPTHAYDSAGSYVVCLSVTDSCGTESTVCDTVTVTVASSIGSDFPYELSIYPNPANTFINLSTTKIIEQVEVFGMNGQQLMSKTTNDRNVQLNVSELAPGIYILRAHVNDAVGTYKLIVK